MMYYVTLNIEIEASDIKEFNDKIDNIFDCCEEDANLRSFTITYPEEKNETF